MILNPRIGAVYQVWYRKSARHLPLHGRCGRAVIAGRGTPRNHGIEIDGRLRVVPCGNLRKAPDDQPDP